MDKILIIRFSSIGDILLTSPLIRVLSKKYPQHRIDVLTKKKYKDLFKNNPNINEIITIKNQGLRETIKIRNKISSQYEFIIDLHANIRSFLVSFFLFKKNKVFRYKKHSIKRRLFVLTKLNLLNNISPVYIRYFNALKKLDIKYDSKNLEFFSDDKSVNEAESFFITHKIDPEKCIVLAPGSRWQTKKWPLNYFNELTKKYDNLHFIILGDKNDADTINKSRYLKNKKNISNLCGKTSFSFAYEILKRAKILICNDSGLMHLGNAANINIIAIFGSSVKEFGFYPISDKAHVFETKIKCRPCATAGKNKCKIKTYKCLKDITPKMVSDQIDKYLSK